MKHRRAAIVVAGGAVAAAALWAARRSPLNARNARLATLGARVGGQYASTAARKVFASTERRIELDRERELRTAEAVAARLGDMKGALMKLGQMASYLDEGLPPALRTALAQLRDHAEPMSAELAAEVVERELGAPPEQIFVEWDPDPIAAASIGQVHRAVVVDPRTGHERAVAVKVQYPGVDRAIATDLRNADMLGSLLRQGFQGLDPTEMVTEIKTRLTEELDYRLEARNQADFARFWRDHPFIHVPEVIEPLCTGRVLTTELVNGHDWETALGWDQDRRNRIGETLFRFVFRSLYGMHAFNGDPHPGNYLFHEDGRVTFLDFGLVKRFSDAEMATFIAMVRTAAHDRDIPAFRTIVEDAGLLARNAPASDEEVGEYFSQFYEPVRDDHDITWSSEYASRVVRHIFDRSSVISQYATVPQAFVFIQRINMGLYALLGELRSTGNYRRIAQELWPFSQAPPSTALGVAEADWLDRRRAPGVDG